MITITRVFRTVPTRVFQFPHALSRPMRERSDKNPVREQLGWTDIPSVVIMEWMRMTVFPSLPTADPIIPDSAETEAERLVGRVTETYDTALSPKTPFTQFTG